MGTWVGKPKYEWVGGHWVEANDGLHVKCVEQTGTYSKKEFTPQHEHINTFKFQIAAKESELSRAPKIKISLTSTSMGKSSSATQKMQICNMGG